MVKPTYSRQCDYQCNAGKPRPGNVVCVIDGKTLYLCGSCANKAPGVWTADSPQRAREIRREREAAERGKRGR